jgi:RNA polymerase-binding transcription factor DksA
MTSPHTQNGVRMNAAFNQGLRRELLTRRDKITSILDNLEFLELETRLKTLGPEEKTKLNRLAMLNALDDWYHKELIEVDNALARIDDGIFGTCLGCGAPIAANFLDVIPAAEFCRSCEDMKKWLELR